MFPYENRSILQIAEDIFILDDNSWHIWAQCICVYMVFALTRSIFKENFIFELSFGYSL